MNRLNKIKEDSPGVIMDHCEDEDAMEDMLDLIISYSKHLLRPLTVDDVANLRRVIKRLP